ncbi:MAG: hypothetical protein AAF810_01325 [Cyanobacteria bacterium P01_D01_bin.36]
MKFFIGFILVAATVAGLVDWRGTGMLVWEIGDGAYQGARSFVNANKDRQLPGVIILDDEQE